MLAKSNELLLALFDLTQTHRFWVENLFNLASLTNLSVIATTMCTAISKYSSQNPIPTNFSCADENCHNYHYGKISVNSNSRTVRYDGKPVNLSPKEYFLLLLFLKYPEQVLSYEAIIERLWSIEKTPTHSSVRSHIKNLRKIFKKAGAKDEIVATIHGVGYRLNYLPKNGENNVIPLPSSRVLVKLIKAKIIEYFVVNSEGKIIHFSSGIRNYLYHSNTLYSGQYIGEAFPKLLEYEQYFQGVLNRELNHWSIQGFAIYSQQNRPQYINIYAIADCSEDEEWSERNLFIFFEDVSELILDKPQPFQPENEA